jgi:transposase-like protein
MDTELRALRREISRRESGPGRRYEPELRARMVAWVAARRRGGASFATVASELSLPKQTVRRLSESSESSPSAARLLPVSVVPDLTPQLVRVVGPSGFFVDALTLEQAAALLRLLR